jgi:hypothetical protein
MQTKIELSGRGRGVPHILINKIEGKSVGISSELTKLYGQQE